MSLKYIKLILLLTVLLPGLAAAVACYDDSPSIRKGIDPKTSIHVRKLTAQETKDLQKLLNGMKGNWEGKAVEVVCKGSFKMPVEDTLEYEVTAKITEKRPFFTLALESSWYSPEKKSTRLENLALHLAEDYFRVNSDRQEGDVELIKVSDTFLVFQKNNIIHNVAGGVIAQEVVRTIAMIQGSLMIEYLTYVNGKLVTYSEWELKTK